MNQQKLTDDAVLLIGNSPNRIQNKGPAWDDLLKELAGNVGYQKWQLRGWVE